MELTLLQAYPSYSRNKRRGRGASLLVSTLSTSEPVGIMKAGEVVVCVLISTNKCSNES